MKKLLAFIVLLCLITTPVTYAETTVGPFLSSGYIEGFYYPKHNEYDPNPMVFPFSERVTARYGLDFETTLALKKFPKVFGFFHSFSAFGNTRPQTSYNYDADPIVTILTYGGGYRFTKHFQVRLTASRHINMGKYKGERLLWSGISVRAEW